MQVFKSSLSSVVHFSALFAIASTSIAQSDRDQPQSGGDRLLNAYENRYQYPKSVRSSERPFIQPETQIAGSNDTEVELRVGYSVQVIPADPAVGLNKDQSVRLRCYNGRMIGPTIRVRPGNKLGITIKNELPVEMPIDDCAMVPADVNQPHGWNCTNLHTHGLHVSPSGLSDNVFLQIRPNSPKPTRLEFCLPSDHVSGTFWYHPHKHGSVAMQLTTGLAGALIVEGSNLDLIPEIRDAFERVMVIQQLKFSPNPDQIVSPQPGDIYPGSATTVAVTLINGQVHPVIRVAPGAVERWRVVHAGLGSSIKLAVLEDDPKILTDLASRVYLPLREIAIDGIPRGKMIEWTPPANAEYPVMYPGYRWDVLFKAPLEPGRYFLVDDAKLATQQLRDGEPATPINFLARIEVAGMPRPMKLPQQADLAAAVPSQFSDITDNEILDGNGNPRNCFLSLEIVGGKHVIDKCPYSPDRLDRVAWLNTAEEWQLSGSGAGHPFHIHVNPFQQLVKDGAGKIVDRIWRDTLLVRSAPTAVRMRFKDFDGKTVLHCHILDHEDRGMMENLLILPAGESLGDRKIRVLCQNQPVTDCTTVATVLKGEPMPRFRLKGVDGQMHSSADLSQDSLVVVFSRGIGCLHCATQLQLLGQKESEFRRRRATIVAITSDDETTLTKAFENLDESQRLPFLLLADGNKEAFKAFRCWNGQEEHGIFVINQARRIVSGRVGSEPFMDVSTVLKDLDGAENGSADSTNKD